MSQNLTKFAYQLDWLIKLFPPRIATKIYSLGRACFIDNFYKLAAVNPVIGVQSKGLSCRLWGIEFRLPLLNAAGMFKNGEGYDFAASIGAGGYLGGTSTHNFRLGNIRYSIKHPFITLPKSGLSVNYLGLPNLGDEVLTQKIITNKKISGCPIGWSVMRSPDYDQQTGLDNLIKSLFAYEANPLIDFIEINESCPNVGADFNHLLERLKYIADKFLIHRKRTLPIIIKLSNDIQINQLPDILDVLFKYKYDGINVGNTSTNYNQILLSLDHKERKLFEWFTTNIGGGVGGKCLKQLSLESCASAVSYRNKINPDYEFHVIRTGGIDSFSDLLASDQAGVALNQWYTGFFTNYIKYGYNLYAQLV